MAKAFDLKRVLAPVDDIIRRLNERRNELLAEVELIDGQLARFAGGAGRNGRHNARPSTTTAPRRTGGRRKRRSREEIEATAREIVEFIKTNGKDGTTGREIKAKFGTILPSVKQWLAHYAPDAKVKTTGKKASMRYHA